MMFQVNMYLNNEPRWINAMQIKTLSLSAAGNGSTIIAMTDGEKLNVSQTPQQVAELASAAMRRA